MRVSIVTLENATTAWSKKLRHCDKLYLQFLRRQRERERKAKKMGGICTKKRTKRNTTGRRRERERERGREREGSQEGTKTMPDLFSFLFFLLLLLLPLHFSQHLSFHNLDMYMHVKHMCQHVSPFRQMTAQKTEILLQRNTHTKKVLTKSNAYPNKVTCYLRVQNLNFINSVISV